jgi:hypothetical protein
MRQAGDSEDFILLCPISETQFFSKKNEIFDGFHFLSAWKQGCQMVYFKAQNPNLGILSRALEWKMLAYFTAVWYN